MSGHGVSFDDVVRVLSNLCREFELSTQGGIYCDACDFRAATDPLPICVPATMDPVSVDKLLAEKLHQRIAGIDTALVQFMSASGATAESLAGHMPPIIVTVQHLEALRKLNAYHAANVAAVRLG